MQKYIQQQILAVSKLAEVGKNSERRLKTAFSNEIRLVRRT